MNAMFSIVRIHVKTLNVSLCGENKQWKCALESVKTASEEHTCVCQDKGVMLGG